MAKLILVSGCSAVGKTRFARQFAIRNEFLYLSPDNIYALLNGDEKIHKNKFEVWMTLFRAIHIAEQSGTDCVVDTNALSHLDRDQFLGWFPSFEHHLVFISASPEQRKLNNSRRERQIPNSVMDAMTRSVEEPKWESLDRRWKSFVRINNVNNNFIIAEKEGDVFYE